MWAAIEKFLASHLGGRYQQRMNEETASRLKEIMVDPTTVTLPEPEDAPAANDDLPQPAFGLTPGISSYKVSIDMGGQTMNMQLTRTVEEVERGWRVSDSATGPMGEVSDSEILAKPSLTPIERETRQGPVSIDLAYSDSRIEGSFTMSGNTQPIAVDLDGPIFSDGAGASLVIAALPLADGYTANYRTFDLMTQKVKPMKATVTGVETVSVPAGSFEAYRVDVGAADGSGAASTIWVARESRQVVKTEARVPQMGNATIVSELQGPGGSN
jgi:hypothetical protein